MSTENNQHISYTWIITDLSTKYSPTFGGDLKLCLKLHNGLIGCENLWHLQLTSQNGSIYEGTLYISIQEYNKPKIEQKCHFTLPNDSPIIKLGLSYEINNLFDEYGDLFISAQIVNDPISELINDFGALLCTKEMADVEIITGDRQEIPAHKLVLSARSKVFAAMFKHPMKESDENCITLSDLSYDVLMEMLRYMYTGKAPDLKEINMDLIAAAEKYQLGGLKAMFEKSMIDNLSIITAPVVLKTADLYNMNHLKSTAVKFIKNNISKVNKTSNWKNLTMTDRQLILESFIDPVFFELPNDDIKENVQSNKIVESDVPHAL